jgi:3'-5' exoribonuclease
MEGFKTAPAALKIHHAYIGGLLEHTLSVVRLCSYISRQYPFLNEHLLLTGALFHDIGKIKEFRCDWRINYSDEGRLIGHIVLGVQIVDNLIGSLPSFPSEAAMLLRHLILSHHGEPDMGTVQLPMTREAMALHLADNLDAKMASINRIYEEAQTEDRWTTYQALYSRRFFLPTEVSAEAESENSRVGAEFGMQLSIQKLLEKLEKNS